MPTARSRSVTGLAVVAAVLLAPASAAADPEPPCTVSATGPSFTVTPAPPGLLPGIRPDGGVGVAVECPLLPAAEPAPGL